MAWQVFYSYSHQDEALRKELGEYLVPLVRQKKIIEWHDRKIQPGANWHKEISDQLDKADLILLLISKDFLASEYCFGIEVETALSRLKKGMVKVVPILLKSCLWKESRFSELQIIPRNEKAMSSWESQDDYFTEVATEISKLVSEAPPSSQNTMPKDENIEHFSLYLELVRDQIRVYAHLYERIRQRMLPSHDRTQRMEEVFKKMRKIATASYPLLDELANSPSPGERLGAVAILQVFANQRYLPFLVKLVGSEKPFVGYHAIRALQFAVGAIDPMAHHILLEAIVDARDALKSASVGFDTDRQTVLRAAEKELRETIDFLKVPDPKSSQD